MYIQITDKCNMTCPHCCFACTKKGSFMSLDTFRNAMKVAIDYDSFVVIGGGEPTLHPHFEKMLLLAIAALGTSDRRAFIVTNGSIKSRAMMLYSLASSGVIEAKLSYDQYHNLEMVDDDVIESFRQAGWLWGPPPGVDSPWRSEEKLVSRGRAKKLKTTRDECACDEMFIKPNGKVYQCGCDDAPQIGDVNTGITTNYSGGCWRTPEE